VGLVLRKTLLLLERAGVPVVVVKGAVLAHTLYASPVERPIRDVDLRVRPRDLDRALAVLSRQMARQVRRSRVYRSAVVTTSGVDLDLESSLGPPFLCGLTVSQVLARSVTAQHPLGFPYPQPELHDHALILAVNAFKDHLVDARSWSLLDLEKIVRVPGFDRDLFARRARAHHASTLVHVVARFLARRSNTDWEEIARLVPPARPAFAAEMLRWAEGAPRADAARRLRIRGASDVRARAAAAMGLAVLCQAEMGLGAWWEWVRALR
jgi:hypothetical protein